MEELRTSSRHLRQKGPRMRGGTYVAHHKSAPASDPRVISSLVFDRLWKSCNRSAASPDTNEKDKRCRFDGHVSVRAPVSRQTSTRIDRTEPSWPPPTPTQLRAAGRGVSRKQTFPQSAACVRHLRPCWDSLMASTQAVK